MLFFVSGQVIVDMQAVTIRNTRAMVKINSFIFNTNFEQNHSRLKGRKDIEFLQVSFRHYVYYIFGTFTWVL